jgi:proline iminopeptidase
MDTFVVSAPEGAIHGWRYDGDGPQAVLLHGGPCMSAGYIEPLVPHLAGVFQLILYQQRGVAPTIVDGPNTVEANVADAAAVIDEAAGGRAWIVGHSWGGHLALHLLAAIPERIAGAVIIDPLGAHVDVMSEFGERMEAPLGEADRARVKEIDAKEEAGTATAEESMESFRLVWPSYFADPPSAPPMPAIDFAVAPFAAKMASAKEHDEAGTLARALPEVPPEIPVLFIHGAASPMPERAATDTAALIPHARVELVEGAGHFTWVERPGEVRDAVAAFVGS